MEAVGQVFPFEELHGDEGHPLADAVVEDLDDVGAAELGGGHRLAIEAGASPGVGGHLGPHELHGAGDLEGQVVGEPHRAHAPLAEQPGQPKALGDDQVGPELQALRCFRRHHPVAPAGSHAARPLQAAIHRAATLGNHRGVIEG